ncbi:uncharacterized protein LOC129793901 [Lutzomyia longipalpis]|nr:uncharacterized protein LOC129793901 [Lutzomyia longipalpis]
MQVGTLFRESAATLLGATSGMIESPVAANAFVAPPSSHPLKSTLPPPGAEAPHAPYTCLDILTGPPHGHHDPGYKILSPSLKHEIQDDGYETSGGDAMTPRNLLPQAKCENNLAPPEDPYNFIDDDLNHIMTFPPLYGTTPQGFAQDPPPAVAPICKKRGRKRKLRNEEDLIPGTTIPKARERKKHDRFNGMPEEEVSKRTLPDHLTNNLDIIIIGINPGLFAAYKGHHYAGPGNHFWKCLYLSGLTHEQMTAEEDYKLLKIGIGFTNMVQRATKGSADLTRKEIKEGCRLLLEKLRRFRPKIAVFNGKLIFEVFSGKKDFNFGRQPDCIEGTNTYMWVMPSSSARCAQLPRAADKVPFYAALKKFRDFLNGLSPEADLDEQEFVFSDPKYKVCCESEPKIDTDPPDGEVKKKRGRPKKLRPEDAPKAPVVKRTPADGTKKKRGRPKKLKEPEQQQFSSPPPIMESLHSISKTPQAYQSPQNSQTFSHSDLSSEISAAISSDLVDSPPTASPPGPPDFEPPTAMPTDGHTPELRYSPFTRTPYGQDDQWQQIREQRDMYKVPDVTTKSLSGLENLVEQIPTMGDVEAHPHMNGLDEGREEQTTYSSCLYDRNEYESVFPPYGSYFPDAVEPTSTYGYSSQFEGYAYSQHFAQQQQMPVPNYAYATYPPTSYTPQCPTPMPQPLSAYRSHAFKPDLTGYSSF